MKLTLFGLGEAGSWIGSDLAKAGLTADGKPSLGSPALSVHAFDPADVPTPAHIQRESCPQAAVENADMVLSLTAAADAPLALKQALEAIPKKAVYADFASASSTLKAQLAERAQSHSIAFCDVALMAIVPGNGLRAPVLISGPGANRFNEIMNPLGMPIEIVSQIAGDAAQHKLLRSVAMKGLAAVLIEALEGAHRAGCAEWLWQNLCDEISKADARMLKRLVSGTELHAKRRLHEMQASQEQLEGLGVQPLMTKPRY